MCNIRLSVNAKALFSAQRWTVIHLVESSSGLAALILGLPDLLVAGFCAVLTFLGLPQPLLPCVAGPFLAELLCVVSGLPVLWPAAVTFLFLAPSVIA